jgi:hypothetical protein
MRSENAIQQEIIEWYKNNYCLVHHTPRCMIAHVPNQNQHHLVSIGVYPGFADLFVWHLCKLYLVEIKEPLKGKQSPNQVKFENHCSQSGIPYFIVFSLEEFKEFIVNL